MDHAHFGIVLLDPLHHLVDDGHDCPSIMTTVVGHEAQADGVQLTTDPYVYHCRVDSDRILCVVRRLHLLTEAHQPILCEIDLCCYLLLFLQVFTLVSHSLVLVVGVLDVDFDAGEGCDQSGDELVFLDLYRART